MKAEAVKLPSSSGLGHQPPQAGNRGSNPRGSASYPNRDLTVFERSELIDLLKAANAAKPADSRYKARLDLWNKLAHWDVMV